MKQKEVWDGLGTYMKGITKATPSFQQKAQISFGLYASRELLKHQQNTKARFNYLWHTTAV
jgi:hypothetical protein